MQECDHISDAPRRLAKQVHYDYNMIIRRVGAEKSWVHTLLASDHLSFVFHH